MVTPDKYHRKSMDHVPSCQIIPWECYLVCECSPKSQAPNKDMKARKYSCYHDINDKNSDHETMILMSVFFNDSSLYLLLISWASAEQNSLLFRR